MHDINPPLPDDPAANAPFGAGIPAQPVEPVRLSPGERRGPAIDVRGQAAPRSDAGAPSGTAASFATPPPMGAGSSTGASTASSAPWSGTAGATAASSSYAGAAGATQASQPPGSPPPVAGYAPPRSRPAGRWWIALAHLCFLIPFPAGVIATAVLWIWRRERDQLMADQGREALNMQFTFWLAIGLLGASCLGHPLVPVAYVLGGVLCVLAAIASANGDRHRYPWVFRFLV